MIEFTYKELNVIIDHYTNEYNEAGLKTRADHIKGNVLGYELWHYNSEGKIIQHDIYYQNENKTITYEYVYGPGGITEMAELLIKKLTGL